MAVTQPARGPAGRPGFAVQNPYSTRPNWVYPTIVFVVFSIFIVYGVWVVLFQDLGRFGPYLSPFFSPEVNVRIGGFLIPPALWVAWAPLVFRLTCYYYRKAYFRGFLWHPRSCAVAESGRGRYQGETRFWSFNNLHRFTLYLIIAQTVILIYDVINAFIYQGGAHFGLGNVIMIVNIVLIVGYTCGCHAMRHLVGGGVDCFSCHRTRYQLWKGATLLNVHHEFWAWASMLSVWATDLYIRLLVLGIIPHGAWN
jgi:hypothetical protein